MPRVMATVTYPDGSELTAEYLYTSEDGLWMGLRLPGETRVDEYPADLCRVWDTEWRTHKVKS